MQDISIPAWLSPLADVLSLIAFGMTVWVLVVTRSLKRTFALRARTPQLRRSLAATAKSLPPLIGAWPQRKNDTLQVLANTRAILENLRRKLPRSERASVKRLVRDLHGRRNGLFRHVPLSQYEEDDLWTIFADLQAMITSLEQREKDATWE
jgi:hypothetical protein